jgi:hypothetical protein
MFELLPWCDEDCGGGSDGKENTWLLKIMRLCGNDDNLICLKLFFIVLNELKFKYCVSCLNLIF